MKRLLLMGAALALPLALFAQKKNELVDIQRDVALLQDQIRTLEQSLAGKLDTLNKLLEQAGASSARSATLAEGLDRGMKEQQKALNAPVATLNTKVDKLTEEMTYLKESLNEALQKMNRLQGQMTDLSNAVKLMQAPPAPPGPVAGTPPAGMTADGLYKEAISAKQAGSLDFALQQFNDYLKYYGQTDLAVNAQFYIGEIYYQQGNLDEALKAFDAALERYPENNKTLDAMYMKGLTLAKMNQKAAAANEFQEIVKKSPNSEIGRKAAAQLRALGGAAPAKRPTTKKK